MNDLRLLIIADDSLARAGLGTLLAGQPGLGVVGQISGEAAGSGLEEVYYPDVILWDLGWDPSSALDQLSELSEALPPILALLPDSTYAAEAWAAGPRGLLPRDVDASRLGAALIAVALGLVVGEPDFSAALPPSGDQTPAAIADDLTPREQQVLQLLAEGLPNKAIASQLSISEHTVKFHVNAIMGKLGAQSRTEAVTRATRAGLILL
ncbi:MAG: response regulator transcription factor [Dehalococcoidia bacterium]